MTTVTGPGWTLHHADCLGVEGMALLGAGSVAHVVTDPPYSAHVHRSGMAGASRTTTGFDRTRSSGIIARKRPLDFEHITIAQIRGVSSHVARVARRWSLVFSDTESDYLWRVAMQRRGAEYVRTCFWRKLAGAPQFTGDRPAVACEAVTVCHPPGRKRWNGGGKQGIYEFQIAIKAGGDERAARSHPTEKPLALMEALLRDFTDPGDLILDPFAGSGTTGVAAIRLGRQFVGYERDAKHFATAVRRLTAAREQFDLFGHAKVPKVQQLKLVGAP